MTMDPGDEGESPVADGFAGPDELVAFRANSKEVTQIVPASPRREWIPQTEGESARWCLPITLANASGWEVLAPVGVTAVWDGGRGLDAVQVDTDGPVASDMNPRSEFGSGIVTFSIPFLFRTPSGWDLLVRGPANRPKDGASALEGLVATDWAVMTFTMNWQITRPDVPVRWDAGEPVCLLVPQRRYDLERFRPRFEPFSGAPETKELTQLALQQRRLLGERTRALRRLGFGRRGRDEFQRLYFRGRYPDGRRAPSHRAAVRLRPFSGGAGDGDGS